ncbi:MaoC family dehydratase [soil metagenome]
MATTRTFEDFKLGDTWTSSPVTVSAQEIMDFGRNYDPQPMHTDVERANSSPFGSLIASGWHIAALSVRVFVQAGGYGDTPVVGLGIDELRWQQPVRAGDTLTFTREVVELRVSASNPGHGIVRTRVTVRNQRQESVMTLVSAGRVPTLFKKPSEEGAAQ